MNNENLYANMKAYADLKRNTFPLSHKRTYSMKLAEITPLACLHTIPGDFMDVQLGDKSLSFPMNTSAFLGARKEIVAYHVPYNHVCSLFNQFQTSRPDPKTSALVKSSELQEQLIPIAELYFSAFAQLILYCFNEYIVPIYYNNKSTGDYFVEFGSQNIEFRTVDMGREDYTLTFNCIPSIQSDLDRLPYDIMRHFNSALATTDPDQPILAFDILGRPRAYNQVRKLDMLGYGNLYPLFYKLEQVFSTVAGNHHVYGDNNGFNSVDELDSDDIAAINSAIMQCFASLCQLCYRGCTVQRGSTTGSVVISSLYWPRLVSLYPILSYNKVFYEFFRNSYYDLDYDVKDYNIDFLYGLGELPDGVTINLFSYRFLDIEYHQYRKDLITGSLPSPQFGAVSELSMQSWVDLGTVRTQTNNVYSPTPNNIQDLQIGHDGTLTFNEDGRYIQTKHNHDVILGSAQVQQSFDVIALKRAEMLQEYRQVLLRNGNRTCDLFKGIYGERPASEEDNSPRFFDAFGAPIFVDTIVSTADTSSGETVKGSLGDLGARCVINSGGHFKFKTSDFGCLLILGYIVPENVYSSFMLDENLLASDPESHFLPFFQNLGFRPIYNHNVNLYLCKNGDSVRGYAPSYSEKKQQLSLAHGNFVSIARDVLLPSLVGAPASQAAQDILVNAGFYDDYVGSFNHWVSLNSLIQNSKFSTLAQYYISPSMWDNVFVQKAGANNESDHFVCHLELIIKSVRVLSKLGLPNF